MSCSAFSVSKKEVDQSANTFWTTPNIIRNIHLKMNMIRLLNFTKKQ
jgi:hypothetical protein